MLHTTLTTSWHVQYPIIGAPMAGAGGGRLAHAVSQAGGLGMLGVGSRRDAREVLAREAAIARGEQQGRFGIGLMAWARSSGAPNSWMPRSRRIPSSSRFPSGLRPPL